MQFISSLGQSISSAVSDVKTSVFGYPTEEELVNSKLRASSLEYSWDDIESITGGFCETRVLGRGTFGTVFKGALHGTEVAVKVIEVEGGFEDEVCILSRFRHPNLVLLMGFASEEGTQTRAIVCEYLSGGNVATVLRRPQSPPWQWRLNIALDSALGLAHLHGHEPEVFHRDIKAENILVDRSGTAKVADFGLACTSAVVKTTAGTPGYADPEYLSTGFIKEGNEIYSFMMVLLELLTMHPPAVVLPSGGLHVVVDAWRLHSSDGKARVLGKLDYRAGWPLVVANSLAGFMLHCINTPSEDRPRFAEVVDVLRDLINGKQWIPPQPTRRELSKPQSTTRNHSHKPPLQTGPAQQDRQQPQQDERKVPSGEDTSPSERPAYKVVGKATLKTSEDTSPSERPAYKVGKANVKPTPKKDTPKIDDKEETPKIVRGGGEEKKISYPGAKPTDDAPKIMRSDRSGGSDTDRSKPPSDEGPRIIRSGEVGSTIKRSGDEEGPRIIRIGKDGTPVKVTRVSGDASNTSTGNSMQRRAVGEVRVVRLGARDSDSSVEALVRRAQQLHPGPPGAEDPLQSVRADKDKETTGSGESVQQGAQLVQGRNLQRSPPANPQSLVSCEVPRPAEAVTRRSIPSIPESNGQAQSGSKENPHKDLTNTGNSWTPPLRADCSMQAQSGSKENPHKDFTNTGNPWVPGTPAKPFQNAVARPDVSKVNTVSAPPAAGYKVATTRRAAPQPQVSSPQASEVVPAIQEDQFTSSGVLEVSRLGDRSLEEKRERKRSGEAMMSSQGLCGF